MTTPTFLEGVVVAVVASVAGSVMDIASATLLDAGGTRLLVGALAFGYVVYLLRRSPQHVGRVTALSAWGIAAMLLWLAMPPISLYLTAHVGMVWLLRSLLFHSGPLAALADLALNGFALAAGLWALVHTGSLSLGVWSFFLVQALFVAVPQGARPRRSAALHAADDRFEHAHRAAEAAVRRLTSRP